MPDGLARLDLEYNANDLLAEIEGLKQAIRMLVVGLAVGGRVRVWDGCPPSEAEQWIANVLAEFHTPIKEEK